MSDWRTVGRADEIPALGARVVDVAGTPVAVFRTGDDEIYALHDSCPHQNGPLSEGMVHGRRVTCPLHGRSVELESGAVVAPDTGCVRSYPVRVRDGAVQLRVTVE